MSGVTTIDIASWRPQASDSLTADNARVIEAGGVLALPRLAFTLSADEQRFLDPRWSDGRAKNINFDRGEIHGSSAEGADRVALRDLVARFAADASALIAVLFPRYAPHLKTARTSFRPQPASRRSMSWRKDDTRLHVDAFVSRPNHGERILRVFCNVNPHGVDRVWRIGEPFDAMAANFLPSIRRMRAGEAALLAALHVTKGRRSEYDHLMLGLHDAAKADPGYQHTSPQQEARFAPGTTWICFSDQVMHAAMGGQYMLEQTIHLPLAALYEPARAPLAVLERLTGRRLTARAG
ncbi:MAG: Kdo hydroxylase family protein [Betaproteobacteria bacterium]